jgi:hypothetical protein
VESRSCHFTILQVPVPVPLELDGELRHVVGAEMLHVLHAMECVHTSTPVPFAIRLNQASSTSRLVSLIRAARTDTTRPFDGDENRQRWRPHGAGTTPRWKENGP